MASERNWRKLYAANQEVIRRAVRPERTEPGMPGLGDLPPLGRVRSAGAAPGSVRGTDPGTTRSGSRGAGGLERRSVDSAGGACTYRLHVPAGAGDGTPLVVVLHGCSQDGADIALGTRWSALADRAGFVAAYPEQSSAANRSGCWNWFLPAHQSRDAGEPAQIAAVVRDVLRGAGGVRPDERRVYLVGMSAGAAMASIVAVAYPDLVAALGLHSGVVYRAAHNVSAAFAVLRNGVDDVAASARQAYAQMGTRARAVPTVLVHGTSDRTVSVANGDQAAEQWALTNAWAVDGGAGLPAADRERQVCAPGERTSTLHRWTGSRGRPSVEYWRISGLGHAWSGGSAAGSFTDQQGPDATGLMWRFFQACEEAGGP